VEVSPDVAAPGGVRQTVPASVTAAPSFEDVEEAMVLDDQPREKSSSNSSRKKRRGGRRRKKK
jgi:hypothetical protein